MRRYISIQLVVSLVIGIEIKLAIMQLYALLYFGIASGGVSLLLQFGSEFYLHSSK